MLDASEVTGMHQTCTRHAPEVAMKGWSVQPDVTLLLWHQGSWSTGHRELLLSPPMYTMIMYSWHGLAWLIIIMYFWHAFAQWMAVSQWMTNLLQAILGMGAAWWDQWRFTTRASWTPSWTSMWHQQEQQSLNANLPDRRRKLGIRAEVWQHSITIRDCNGQIRDASHNLFFQDLTLQVHVEIPDRFSSNDIYDWEGTSDLRHYKGHMH